jgi:ADP-ribose pyrophosphatase
MYEKTLKSERVYEGRILSLDVLDVELDNGVHSMREVVRHHGAVAVLAVLDDGTLVLVRQFRKAADREFTEVVAGLLEPGEQPEDCARRELREETGYNAVHIEKLVSMYPSPGYVDETIEVFLAWVDGMPGDTEPDHDELLEVEMISCNEMHRRVMNGEIQDAKTLVAWLLAEKRIAAGLP